MVNFSIEHSILEISKQGKPQVIATLIESKGSTPRHIGAKMIVTKDSIVGTIGGGILEKNVVSDSRQMLLKKKGSIVKEYKLPACGGIAKVFIETRYPSDRLLIFGAGHVAKSLTPLAIESGFAVTIIDFRDEWLNLVEYKNTNKIKMQFSNVKKIATEKTDYIVIMTPDHKYDENVLNIILKKDYKYLGLMSSKHKWEAIKQRLIKKKFNNNKINSVHAPIGLKISSETPIEIAISIMAELIKIRGEK